MCRAASTTMLYRLLHPKATERLCKYSKIRERILMRRVAITVILHRLPYSKETKKWCDYLI